jgi:hypothetical protein
MSLVLVVVLEKERHGRVEVAEERKGCYYVSLEIRQSNQTWIGEYGLSTHIVMYLLQGFDLTRFE